MEPHRPQHDCHAVYVIAQQYSSATFDVLLFHSRIEKFFFLGAFAKLRKVTISFVMSAVRLSAWNNWAPMDGFLCKLLLEYFFRKSEEKVKASLKSDNNNGYFT
jgi:hypothetical protein